MASTNNWKRLAFRLWSSATTSKALRTAGVCTVCGTAFVFSFSNPKVRNWFAIKPNEVHALANSNTSPNTRLSKRNEAGAEKTRSCGARERRFRDFASVQVNGELFMTPQDFLESVTDENPRPRIGQLSLCDDEVRRMLKATPPRKKNFSGFFRSLHNRGLVSYTEYLFFLSILTKPNAGFRIAFNMFDTDGNQRVDKKEFLVLEELFREKTDNCPEEKTVKISSCTENIQDTTLLVHFFGQYGKNSISYEEFYSFMDNLQTEILEMEFLAYSRGMATISEEDFARMLLRYSELDDIEECIEKLLSRLPEEKGINFQEFRSFFKFLNNLEDFAISMNLYTMAGRAIGQDEFARAVKISTGHELSSHLVDTLFKVFDKDGDNKLSHVEFIGVMKDRIHRGFRPNPLKYQGWKGFQKCIRINLQRKANQA